MLIYVFNYAISSLEALRYKIYLMGQGGINSHNDFNNILKPVWRRVRIPPP
jgi:hypothetical protein